MVWKNLFDVGLTFSLNNVQVSKKAYYLLLKASFEFSFFTSSKPLYSGLYIIRLKKLYYVILALC